MANLPAFPGLLESAIGWAAHEVGLTAAIHEGEHGVTLGEVNACYTIALADELAKNAVDPLPKTLWQANLLWKDGKLREASVSFVEAARLSRLLFHSGPYPRALAARVQLLAGAYLLLLPDIQTTELSRCFRLFEDGADFYRHALERPPKEFFSLSAEAHERMAYSLIDSGQRDEAMQHYVKAGELRERVSPKAFPKAIARYRSPKK
jgi:tetratricopeptide (TPR) repeat protein